MNTTAQQLKAPKGISIDDYQKMSAMKYSNGLKI